MSVQAVTHVGICVSDLERARALYRDVLGFKELSKLSVDDATSAKFLEVEKLDLHCIFLERDGLRIELMDFRGQDLGGDGHSTPLYHRGLTHFCLRVSDLDAILERLEAAGATVLHHTAVANEAYQSRIVFAVDPDGVRLELIESPGDPKAVLGEPL